MMIITSGPMRLRIKEHETKAEKGWCDIGMRASVATKLTRIEVRTAPKKRKELRDGGEAGKAKG